MIEQEIRAMDDETACRVLATIAQARLHAGAADLPPSAELKAALIRTFDLGDVSADASEGELARQALVFLASEDPSAGEIIASLAEQSPPQRFEFTAAGILLTTAVLVILQTEVDFRRDKSGRWTVKVRKKSGGDALLQPLVKKLLALFGK